MILSSGYVKDTHKEFDSNGIILILKHGTLNTVNPAMSEEAIEAIPMFKYKNDWIRPYKGQKIVYATYTDEALDKEVTIWLGTDDIFVYEDLDYSQITRVISDPIGNRIIFGNDKIQIDQVGTEFIGESKQGAGIINTPETENPTVKNAHINKVTMEVGKINLTQFKKGSESTPENKFEMFIDTDKSTKAISTIIIKQKYGNEISLSSENEKEKISIKTGGGAQISLDDSDGSITINSVSGKTVTINGNFEVIK